ncbi:hypothetical protein DPMN_157195 [Dreissena polymorpha]|uniref:Uncharacterized protein n=2 Tax=Dreissena polymorpha TaxID=45954 RepID=A0A9D4EGR7_DREPO|nr:hypothetical protein DPMN_157195 [Dreissena polymorpha]
MGCGRSQQQSPTQGNEEDEMYSKPDGHKKKKSKGEKKEHKHQHVNSHISNSSEDISSKATKTKNSPIKAAATLLKPPASSHVNGSSESTKVTHIDVDIPGHKADRMDHLIPIKVPVRDGKEFTGTRKDMHITHSQIEFFKMLDEKIEQGDDYSSKLSSRATSRVNSIDDSLERVLEISETNQDQERNIVQCDR